MTALVCPSCREDLRRLQPPDAWPGVMICPNFHRWRLPLPLTLPGLAPPPQPAISNRVRAYIDATAPREAMRTAARRARARRPSRSAIERPFWTR